MYWRFLQSVAVGCAASVVSAARSAASAASAVSEESAGIAVAIVVSPLNRCHQRNAAAVE